MFNFNELRFLDHLIDEYLRYNQNLPLKLRNQILKLDNKILDYMKNIEDAKQREIEEDKKYIREITK